MPTLPIAKLVFRGCCALVLSGTIPDSSAADLLNTQSRKAHVLRVAGAQLPVRNDVQKNLEAITRAIEFAAREKAEVLVTPEGSLSGYTHNFNAAATAQALEVIVERARQAKVALVLGTCFSDTDGARYDAPAILIIGEMGAPGEGTRPTRGRFCGGCRPGVLTRRGVPGA